MEEKIEIIKKHLTEIGEELFKKYGTDSYQLRCMIYDVKDSVSKLHQPTVISAVCEHTKGICKVVDKKHTMKCDDCGEIIWQTDL